MKVDKHGSTDFLTLPAGEAEKIIEAMKQAEQTDDTEALKWCARRIVWLDDTSEITGGDDSFYPEHVFNKTWAEILDREPPPESIAAIINREDEQEAVTAADAESALNTVKAFFEENIAKKKLTAALISLDELRAAVEAVEGGE